MSEPARIEADYLVETAYDPRRAVEAMAGEQSSGTFVVVPGETPELKARSAARIEALELLEEVAAPALPGAGWPKGQPDARPRRARATLSWPIENMGASLPNLIATVAGNLFELKQLSGLRLLDIRLPHAFADAYPGPQFGIPGTRRLAGVEGRPLIGTIIKPSVGFGPQETADVVATLCQAGIDFIKDDELQGNGPSAPLEARVKAVMPVLERHADRTGVKPMYAFNITDDIGRLEANHDLVVEAGGTCVMACINLIGLSGVEFLRRHSAVPIHGHRAMFGAISRSDQLGFSFRAWQKLARLAGVDHLHTNGISNKFYEADVEVLDSIAAVREPLLGQAPVVPVLSSGQWAGLAHATYAATGTSDLLVLAGGGIHGHPDGSAAGVAAMREAWASAERGESVEAALASSAAFRRATEIFGAPRA